MLIYRHFIQYLIAIYITEQQGIIKHLQVRDGNQSMFFLLDMCRTVITRQICIHKATSTDSLESARIPRAFSTQFLLILLSHSCPDRRSTLVLRTRCGILDNSCHGYRRVSRRAHEKLYIPIRCDKGKLQNSKK